MQHWLVKEYAKLVGNHLQIWSGSFTGRGGGGSWPSEATASGFEKKTGPYQRLLIDLHPRSNCGLFSWLLPSFDPGF